MSQPAELVDIPTSPDAHRPWWDRFGLAVDRLLNVLFLDGDDTWTVSLHSAVAQRQGKQWGCVLCVILSVLVQHDHCAITLDPNLQETTGAAIKAGVLMLILIAATWLSIHYLISTIYLFFI